MKIFFRYLFVRLLIPFVVTLVSCTMIWIMVDLYGNFEDFLSHKIDLKVIAQFYLLQIPGMLVMVLPAAILFASLWTLLSLNRRSELVAFQAGGMSPLWIFSPFVVFSLVWVGILFWDLQAPVADAQVTRDRLLQQVKGQKTKPNVFENLPYVDKMKRTDWFFRRLDVNHGTAVGVQIVQRDVNGHDVVEYNAQTGTYTDGAWRLTKVQQIDNDPDGMPKTPKYWEEKDLDITTPPQQLSLIISQPEQLTVAQLEQYIRTSTASQENLAQYHTEWWYRILSPLGLLVLLLFALFHGLSSHRRSAVMSIVWAIVVLLLYTIIFNIFISAGKHNHMPPFWAVVTPMLIFAAIGLTLLGQRNGWWWQILQWLRPKAGTPS